MNLGFKHPYFIGIGGIGVSAIAKIFHQAGISVSGSDLKPSSLTSDLEKRGVKIFYEQKEKNIKGDVDVVIYSPAIPESCKELQEAKKRKLPLYSYPQFLGLLMHGKKGIAISGTNGKSTTTAMIGLILKNAGLKPEVIVGSQVPGFDGNVLYGKGDYFVAEGCEYRRNFLHLAPQIEVITNIEGDHLDYYRDIEDIKDAFFTYFLKLPEKGLLVYNADDPVSKELADKLPRPKLAYGVKNKADVEAQNIRNSLGRQEFEVLYQDKNLGTFKLNVPGRFNLYNALAAISLALSLQIPLEVIKKTLKEFNGIWRRFEKIGEWQGKTIISDYAHHPTAVAGTIEAAMQFFPRKKILFVFQPHQHNRTKKLFSLFVEALGKAPHLLLLEIFEVAGREEKDLDVSSLDLAKALQKEGKKIYFAKDLSSGRELIKKIAAPFDVLIFMGAGDIDQIARELVKFND